MNDNSESDRLVPDPAPHPLPDGGPPEERPSLADYQAEGRGGRALECPECGCRHFLVKSTWHLKDGTIRRNRVCRLCGYVITTRERTSDESNPDA